jgi:hypothetical protein
VPHNLAATVEEAVSSSIGALNCRVDLMAERFFKKITR